MAKIETRYDAENQGVTFRGQMSDLEILMCRNEDELLVLVERVRRQLVERLVDQIMERFGPVVAEALSEALEKMVANNKPPELPE